MNCQADGTLDVIHSCQNNALIIASVGLFLMLVGGIVAGYFIRRLYLKQARMRRLIEEQIMLPMI